MLRPPLRARRERGETEVKKRRQTQEDSGKTGIFPIMAESNDMEQLLAAFKKFAIHGDTKATGKELNGKNWAKLCKDCKIIDGKNVTGTDVDIVFSKVKQKMSRVITYEEFQRALEELAPKRFKGQSKQEALQSIFRLVEGREPTNVGVTKQIPHVPPRHATPPGLQAADGPFSWSATSASDEDFWRCIFSGQQRDLLNIQVC
ncbi:tubulin polymerization-promoting protein family member 3 isoform X2 [Trachinotus anak]|uniref:tubulin polymerization-promoting protein family member 3-like isoform X2 n=1 Tax=Trachinotus anak TaxID=443729 RepID=UPI0039F1C50F